MIKFKVNWFIYKEMLRCYLIGKLTPKEKDISEIVYEGVLRKFYISDNEPYVLYFKNAPKGKISLEDLLKEEGLINWKLTDEDLRPYFDFIVDHLTNKLFYTNCKVADYWVGKERYLKVYKK